MRGFEYQAEKFVCEEGHSLVIYVTRAILAT